MSKERFYQERDRRAAEYGLPGAPFGRPAGIVVSQQAAQSRGGQIAVMALTNMAARLHRTLRLVVPDVPLLVPSMVAGNSLTDEVRLLVQAIDPYNDFELEVSADMIDIPDISIGVGDVKGVPLSIGADGYLAHLSAEGMAFSSVPSTSLGAGMAACLGSAALTRLALGELPAPVRFSLWDLAEGEAASPGPIDGPWPLDVGSVAVIGAGAVGSALAYWLHAVGGVAEDWEFVDGDLVELHNTGRALGLLPAHAGWVDGEAGHPKSEKAPVAARLLGARSFTGWYDQWVIGGGHPDLVLPLANGPGLRSAIGQRGEPILIHATTSRSWTAELHRHLASRDGCIACRFPENAMPQLSCSTSPLPGQVESNDASLAFLSGTAGLLLLTGLIHLANGRMPKFGPNHWQVHLDLASRTLVSRHRWQCGARCDLARNLQLDLRRALPRGQRWAHLDTLQ